MEEYRKPVAKAAVSPARTIPQDPTIECQCRHRATINNEPTDLIGQRLRYTNCGEDPLPF
ncbi:hypothetical protein [Microvirga guangxiensis]|nr:hypothetical protein [Microvirga guangxiensis]